jgi:hypothetical protein
MLQLNNMYKILKRMDQYWPCEICPVNVNNGVMVMKEGIGI